MWVLDTVKPCLYSSLRVVYVGFRYVQAVFILVIAENVPGPDPRDPATRNDEEVHAPTRAVSFAISLPGGAFCFLSGDS